MPRQATVFVLVLVALTSAGLAGPRAQAQSFERELDASGPVSLSVKNRHGRVTVTAVEELRKVTVGARAPSGAALSESDVKVSGEGGKIVVAVGREEERREGPSGSPSPASASRERIDLVVRVPARSTVEVETEAGAVDVVGPLASADVKTDTGTIRADVPVSSLRYSLRWTLSRPRFYSEVELGKVKEKRWGVYEVSGRVGDKKAKKEERVELRAETARGVILFGVADESSVPPDLRERKLTEAARAIIRSGDSDMIDSIRKIAPKLVGDYTETLPPSRSNPTFSTRRSPFDVRTSLGAELARINASVTDHSGRALKGLAESDFTVVEDGAERRVRDVSPSTAPFNLVLLLDVSGSVEERLDFIRKAALAFVQTVGPQDRVAITSFRDDIQVISDFTTDRAQLARSIKSIQAGGSTALYDALGYTLVDTLKPMRGERTAIVILSDGDDNRSFIPFSHILEAVLESGAVVYPLYIPSGLMPASGETTPSSAAVDPIRSRFLTLTSRAEEEGRRLAEVSGGVYYPITRIEQLQRAYDDVVAQLRTSYSITYESAAGARRDARVRVRVAREGASVRLSPPVSVNAPAVAP